MDSPNSCVILITAEQIVLYSVPVVPIESQTSKQGRASNAPHGEMMHKCSECTDDTDEC